MRRPNFSILGSAPTIIAIIALTVLVANSLTASKIAGAPLAQATATATTAPTSTPTSTPTRIANSLTMRFAGDDMVPVRVYSNGDGTYSISVVVVTPVP